MHNRTIKLLAVALFVPTLAQARQISGLVLSENDSTAIVGAVCELKSDAATAIKAAGDVNGAFTINTSIPRTEKLRHSVSPLSDTGRPKS